MTAKEKFQSLLRELFEFDCADLDFGIYRIMNHKREVIERFISEDLPKAISEELGRDALANESQAQKALDTARQKVLDTLGEDALDAEGNLVEKYREIKIGKEYIEAQTNASGSRSTEALETSVYNHLYAFFSRYYQEGDFISKRRYSKKERYAVPYNGEEVYLYWANHDQYCVKTAEHFTNYTWQAPNGVTVHFKLKAADVEQNNVKGEKRFFLPRLDEITWDANVSILTIPFEFRPLTQEEQNTYGQRNQQEAIIAEALEKIPKHLPKNAHEVLAALTAQKLRADGTEVTLLEHHLRQYTRRNTSDFFIHKDLNGFLSRELDFYLKNEVLNLEEMEAAGEGLAEGWFQLIRLIKRIGLTIIGFLAQIEDFQKMLWEKKKFVTETFYVITVGNIPETFYPEIAENEAQWEEWKALGMMGENPADRLAFLKAHPSLPLDTRHFPADFTDRLLASFEDLDKMTDGLLVHSENWQALNLLQEKYRKRVKCVYIDPPYNTGSDDFIYRDGYQHASWLSMLDNRTEALRPFMGSDAAIFTSIDDHEQANLRKLYERVWGSENFVANIIWQKKYSPQNDARWLSDNHDFVLCFANYKETWKPGLLPRTEQQDARYQNPDNDPRGPWKPSGLDVKTYSAEYDYEIVTPSGRVVRPPKGSCWRVSIERFQELVADNRIWFGPNGDNVPAIKRFLSEVKQGITPLTLWTYKEVGHNQEGAQELKNMMQTGDVYFTSPKPTRLLQRIITIGADKQSIVLDFFAGSGTTGHAVINLNREDGGRRKFILVEMADYFDTVLLPRLQKVTFSPEWKDGKPKRVATAEEAERGPRIIKVIRLESYEDALNNLSFDESVGQTAMQFKDYLLKYMLRWETRESETLLNVEKLSKPFDYCLHIYRDGETRVQKVDLPETFNYLIGLDVAKRHLLDDDGRCYLVYRGTTREGKRTVVIWRENAGWTEEDYKRDRDFVAKRKLTEGADAIYVNGDSLIPGAQALEGVFKARMFAGGEG